MAAFTVLLLSPVLAICATRGIPEEYGKLLDKGRDVTALGENLFGDTTSLYGGTTEFSVVDVSIPGNSDLAVEFRRRFVIEDRQQDGYVASLANWDIDVPFLKGTFAESTGWIVSGPTPNNRCSVSPLNSSPPSVQGFPAEEYWHGYSLHLPGSGDQDLLTPTASSPAAPTSGGPYYWLTKNLTFLSCAPLANGAGEGFVAVTPDGTKITFDWMIVRGAAGITKQVPPPASMGKLNPDPGTEVTDPPPEESPDGIDPPSLGRSTVFLMARKITDRFNNTVTYSYTGDQLTAITASDGRSITITYLNNRVRTVTASGSVWTYTYDPRFLIDVQQPDTSHWTYAHATGNGLGVALWLEHSYENPPLPDFTGCMDDSLEGYDTFDLTVTSPSNATGQFHFEPTRHGRTGVEKVCMATTGTPGHYRYPPIFDSFALTKKTISGPGLTSQTWTTSYKNDDTNPFCRWQNNQVCLNTKTVTVTAPDGVQTVSQFGTKYLETEGQLQSLKVIDAGKTLRDTATTYTTAAQIGTPGFPFPDHIGNSSHGGADVFNTEMQRPETKRVIAQDDATFTAQTTAFDSYAAPTTVTKSSSLGFSKTEITTYYHNINLWVIGQVASVKDQGTGLFPSETAYDPATALPTSRKRFGQLEHTLNYWPDGTLKSATDGNNHTTSYGNWKRGLPQLVTYADNVQESAAVNDRGWITSWNGTAGYATGYQYDPMGRLAVVNYPAGDTVAWLPTTLTFKSVPTAEYGVPGGHWTQTITTGNAKKETIFDARWRPVVIAEYDSSNKATTQRFTVQRWDHANRKTFESYKQRTISGYLDPALDGVATTYDGLGRTTETLSDSEIGPLLSTTDYLSGFVKRTTNPRGYITTATFQAFDEPSEDAPMTIVAASAQAEQVTTAFKRNVFGLATEIKRSGTYQGAVSVTRNYTFDSAMRLCKSLDPESGATVYNYDNANNLAWSASGQALPDTSPSACERASVPASAKAIHTYNTRDQRIGTTFGDGGAPLVMTYTPDNLVETATSGTGGNAVKWQYGYNKRRLGTTETLTVAGQNYAIGWSYTPNGHPRTISYPDASAVDYSPNALGEPTKAGSYATTVSWAPNGGLTGFTYGNGVVHSTEQNTRGLPSRSYDTGVLDTYVGYDQNGNPQEFTDATLGSLDNRTLGYDGLDRLTSAAAPNLWGSGSFSYDPLDNVRQSTIGNRTYTHTLDANNRLAALKTGNVTTVGYGYNPRGDVIQRGSQAYTFDLAHRLTTVAGIVDYTYDAWGRRTKIQPQSGSARITLYSRSGQLLYETSVGAPTDRIFADGFDGNAPATTTRYIYLSGSEIARQGGNGITFVHTDALQSPVALTDAAKKLVGPKRHYEPYGAPTDADYQDGPGFTGHYVDKATRLVYMQQRYMDPLAPRFLSMDPAAVDGTASNFNRYAYANNTPYRKVDPDGRDPVFALSYAYNQNEVIEPINDALTSVGMAAGREAVGFVPGGEVGLCAAGGCGVGGWAAAVVGVVPGEGIVAKVGAKVVKAAGEIYRGSKLARAMAKEGRGVLKGEQQAHHVVAKNAPEAAEARAGLQKNGIDIDSAANGAAMKTSAHQRIHTKDMYDRVNQIISKADAKGPGAVEKALKEIAKELEKL